MSGKKDSLPELEGLLSEPKLDSGMTDVLINPESKDLLLVGKKPAQGQEDTREIILEEFPKSVYPLDKVKDFASKLAEKVYTSSSSSFLTNDFVSKLVILPEDTFRYFVTYATEVVPNIRIDDKTGTSKEGLRYTEYLPSDTILYSLIGFEKAKSRDAGTLDLDSRDKVKKLFDDKQPSRIQIGADETKGKGFVELSLIK